MTSWMIDKDDPARLEVAARAVKLDVAPDPDKAAHPLGKVMLADGREVDAHVIHAVDAAIVDGTYAVMINRLHDPGKGKPALAGGLIDPLQGGGVETAIQAAAREALEEAGARLNKKAAIHVGRRNLNRPFDVRVAIDDGLFEKYGIRKGDIFMVSTQLVLFSVRDLTKTRLKSGDDAEPGSARLIKIKEITKEMMGIPDHYDMLRKGVKARALVGPPQKVKKPRL